MLKYRRSEWYGSQVVRQRSAKPLFAGSIPARTSIGIIAECRFSVIPAKAGIQTDGQFVVGVRGSPPSRG